jgi:hypothetical protein
MARTRPLDPSYTCPTCRKVLTHFKPDAPIVHRSPEMHLLPARAGGIEMEVTVSLESVYPWLQPERS